MNILAIRPAPPGGDFVARFDVELHDRLRLFGLTLKRGRDGCMRVFAPNCAGRHAASFHPDLSNELAQAAVAALGSADAHDCRPAG